LIALTVSAVAARVEPISVAELYTQLVSHEQRLELHNGGNQSSINAAVKGNHGNNNNSSRGGRGGTSDRNGGGCGGCDGFGRGGGGRNSFQSGVFC
jgi:hypothetical protein